MSNRQIGRLYAAQAGRGGGGGRNLAPDEPGLLEQIFGKGVSPGSISTDPNTGMPTVNPFSAPGGFLNRAARVRAAELNQPLLQQQMVGQQQRAQSIQDSINTLAQHLGVTPDQVTGSLKQQLYDTADKETKMRLENMDSPDFKSSFNFGENARATGLPPTTLFPNVPAGGTALSPNVPGVTTTPNIVRGAIAAPQKVEYMTVPDGKGGTIQIPRMAVGGGQQPGQVSIPANPNILGQARNLGASSSEDNITPTPSMGGNGMFGGRDSYQNPDGFFSTNSPFKIPSRMGANGVPVSQQMPNDGITPAPPNIMNQSYFGAQQSPGPGIPLSQDTNQVSSQQLPSSVLTQQDLTPVTRPPQQGGQNDITTGSNQSMLGNPLELLINMYQSLYNGMQSPGVPPYYPNAPKILGQ